MSLPYFTKIELYLITISKILGAFKFSEHNCSPNFSTANILNAQIKKMRAYAKLMESIEVESAVRGYHVYQSLTIGETLVCKREGGNVHDRYCYKPDLSDLIGHVPKKISILCHIFLRNPDNEITCVTSGPIVRSYSRRHRNTM